MGDRGPPPDDVPADVPADDGEDEEMSTPPADQEISLDDDAGAAADPPADDGDGDDAVDEEEDIPLDDGKEEVEEPKEEPAAEPPKDEYMEVADEGKPAAAADDDDEEEDDPLSAALAAEPEPVAEPEPEPEPEAEAKPEPLTVAPPVVEAQPASLPVEPAAPAQPAEPAKKSSSASAAAAAPAKIVASPKRKTAPSREHAQSLDVTVSNPERVGDGMSAYIAYTVDTKTTMPAFRQPSSSIKHRFSEFLSLYKYLAETYQGMIVAVCPPKDAIGTSIIKLKSSGTEITPFIERRAAALDRFLRRLCDHPVIREDAVLRAFLESEEKVPKPKTNTLAVMAAKLSSFMETDEWFEDKQREIDTLDAQLKKLHVAAEGLVARRKELSSSTTAFAESFAALAEAEEVAGLTKAMHQMADVEAKIAKLHNKHAARDFYDFGEIINDYVTLVTAIRHCFVQRVIAYKDWQAAEATLTKKNEAEAKFKAQNKSERLPQAAQEVSDAKDAAAAAKKHFEELSATVRGELEAFEGIKVKELQETMVSYVEAIMTLEHQTVKAWEAFLPEAKAIETL